MNVANRADKRKKDDDRNETSDVNFYTDLPTFELDVDEFEQLALSRLKVLRKIEDLKARNFRGDSYRDELNKAIKGNLHTSPNIKERKRSDLASHYILRAAYCRSEDLRRWFVTQECHLLRHRLEHLGNARSLKVLQFLEDSFDVVSEQEKNDLRDLVLSVPLSGNTIMSLAEFNRTPFYKVPFSQAVDLVRSRQVYIQKGYAYVPLTMTQPIVVARFRSFLQQSLTQASHQFASSTSSSEFNHVAPLLNSMNQQYTGKEYTDEADPEDSITISNIESVVDRSMPLCMRQLHKGLKKDHKLRYYGRLQYSLFLKGAGMTLEDSMMFFEKEFTKIMSSDQFRKDWGYNLRHIYGKEGKRVSKSPYNCMKIIMGQAPQVVGDHHGCPFKHYGENELTALLSSLKIGGEDSDAILGHKKRMNYNLACVRHFEAVHPNAVHVPGIDLDGLGNHPNAWFHASLSYHKHKNGGVSNSVKMENIDNATVDLPLITPEKTMSTAVKG